MSRALAALALLLVTALLVLGCGGGEDGQSASSPTGSTRATSTSAPGDSQQQGARQEAKPRQGRESSKEEGGPSAAPSHRHPHAAVRVPPISSAPVEGSTEPAPGVKTTASGDNSVQEYGTEQSPEERTEAAIALQGYLNARLEEDWGKVCSYLAQGATEQLKRFVQGPKGEAQGLSGCPDAMAALGAGTPPSLVREQATITEVLSFRGGGDVPGDPSYLIFTGPPGKTLFSMPMYLEGSRWKVGLALPSELPV